ncbi:hypothetical protein GGR56DRAFT_344541 [Xylariaceae sp. FL0804]|nr:hypothetical protein GGR56DRAFT_344541 [Xylariaceae sp. FL0804]
MDPSNMDYARPAQPSPSGCPALRAAAAGAEQQQSYSQVPSPSRATPHFEPAPTRPTYRNWGYFHPPPMDWVPHLGSPPPLPHFTQDPYYIPPAATSAQSGQAGQLPAQPAYHWSHGMDNYMSRVQPTLPPFHSTAPILPGIGSAVPLPQSPWAYSGPDQPGRGLQRPEHRANDGDFASFDAVFPTAATRAPMAAPVPSENVPPGRGAAESESARSTQTHNASSPLHSAGSRSIPGAQIGVDRDNESSRSALRPPPEQASAASQDAGVSLARFARQHRMAPAAAGRPQRRLPRLYWHPDEIPPDDEPPFADHAEEAAMLLEMEADAVSRAEETRHLQQMLRGSVSTRRVASRGALAALQSVDISDLPKNERSCVICYNEFGVENPEGINEAPLRLPKCKHVFGDYCIKKWFEDSDSCPYCRDKVPSQPAYRFQGSQGVLRLIRQQQLLHAQALRHAARDRNPEARSSDPNSTVDLPASPVTNTPSRYVSKRGRYYRVRETNHATSPFAEFAAYTTARRLGSPNSSGIRNAGSTAMPERRSPPQESNENRRRTRARHGSTRTSPPSLRSSVWGASSTSNVSPNPVRPSRRPRSRSRSRSRSPHHPFESALRQLGQQSLTLSPLQQHLGMSRPQSHRPALNFGGGPSIAFEATLGVDPLPYFNPLQPRRHGASEDYPAMLPQMRPGPGSPLSPTIPGPEVSMINANDDGLDQATPQHQS